MIHHSKLRFTLSILMVFSLISATISPACAFISGKSGDFLEICTSQGIKKIPMPEGVYTPDLPAEEKESDYNHKSPCLFCFAAHTVHGLEDSISAITPSPTKLRPILFQKKAIKQNKPLKYQNPSTGPPQFS